MADRISHPSRTPIPRNDRTEVRFALSYEALKMKLTSASAQISAIFLAMRQANFPASIPHGPGKKSGRSPPMVTLPTRNVVVFKLIPNESRNAGNLKGCFLLSCVRSEERRVGKEC